MKVDGIINALECCLVDNNDWAYTISCDECVFGGCAWEGDGACRESCSNGIAEEAIHVIKSQEVEIEQLTATKEALIKTYRECQIEFLKGFVARMKAESTIVLDTPTKENFLGAKYTIDMFVFDKLVNEMVGD